MNHSKAIETQRWESTPNESEEENILTLTRQSIADLAPPSQDLLIPGTKFCVGRSPDCKGFKSLEAQLCWHCHLYFNR